MRSRNSISLALLSVLAVFGVARAVQLGWNCDDAFISYRYADNLVEGHGLVYNAGERVEGYTNPLWTLLVAGSRVVGVAPVVAGVWLGIASYLALVATLAAWSWRRSRREGDAFVPLAAALVLAMPDFHVWATGGLETMLYAALATAGLLATTAATRGAPSVGRALGAGLLLALTMLTRPDGALFALAGTLSPWIGAAGRPLRRRLGLSFAIGLPVLLLNGAHLAWKLSYYGELLPTAFHSKSASDPYFGQGLFYLRLLFERNVFLAPLLVLAAAFATARLVRSPRAAPNPSVSSASPASSAARDAVLFAGTCLLFLAYVAWTGGDFMYARRAIPALPLAFLACESVLVRGHTVGAPRLALGGTLFGAAAVVLALFPRSIYGPVVWARQGVADERHFYPDGYHESRRRQAEAVGAVFEGTPLRAMFQGGMCSFGYFSRLPYLVEMTGLTQMSLAKTPITERGHVGHEKSASEEWLDENRIHLIFSKFEASPPAGERMFNELYIGEKTGALIRLYDDAVMDPLRGRDDVFFVPIEDVVANLSPAVVSGPLEQAEQHFAILSHYYFRSGGERARQIEAELLPILERRRREERPVAPARD